MPILTLVALFENRLRSLALVDLFVLILHSLKLLSSNLASKHSLDDYQVALKPVYFRPLLVSKFLTLLVN